MNKTTDQLIKEILSKKTYSSARIGEVLSRLNVLQKEMIADSIFDEMRKPKKKKKTPWWKRFYDKTRR